MIGLVCFLVYLGKFILNNGPDCCFKDCFQIRAKTVLKTSKNTKQDNKKDKATITFSTGERGCFFPLYITPFSIGLFFIYLLI